MRDPSSFACARAAKMLTWLRSSSSATTAGSPVSGRGATPLEHEALVRRADGFDFVHERVGDLARRPRR